MVEDKFCFYGICFWGVFTIVQKGFDHLLPVPPNLCRTIEVLRERKTVLAPIGRRSGRLSTRVVGVDTSNK